MPGTSSTVPASTLTPDGRMRPVVCLLVIAMLNTSSGVRASNARPGMCSSPAETIEVVPPCR
jgi:hypothetical protein